MRACPAKPKTGDRLQESATPAGEFRLSSTSWPGSECDNVTGLHRRDHSVQSVAEYIRIPFRMLRWWREPLSNRARPYPRMRDEARDRDWRVLALFECRRSWHTPGRTSRHAAAIN